MTIKNSVNYIKISIIFYEILDMNVYLLQYNIVLLILK